MREVPSAGDPSLSFWWREATEGTVLRETPLEGHREADVCIVGGGFTGLWTALELKRREPDLRIAIVERSTCGSGASGRNAGFVLSWWAKFETLEKLCGTDEALRLARSSAEAVVNLEGFCETHEIDAHYRRDGWLWTATSEAQLDAWASTLEAIEKHGEEPFLRLSAEEIARRTGSARHLGGVWERCTATIQPARLALGLRRLAVEAGIEIFEQTPMTELLREPTPTVRTPEGEVKARRVILALNAWGIGIPEIRKAIAVVSSDMIVTKPIPEILRSCGRANGEGVSDSRTLVRYDRTTLDGRLAFGRGGGGGAFPFGGSLGTSLDGASPMVDTLHELFREMYPELSEAPIEQSWTGPVARSWDGLPYFGRLPDHREIMFGVGYSGNGLGPSMIGARILASLALDTNDEWASCGLVRPLARHFPPEPIRYLGAKLIRRAVEKREAADDENRRPGALVRALAALAPGTFAPVKR